jgi:hypothetical protein
MTYRRRTPDVPDLLLLEDRRRRVRRQHRRPASTSGSWPSPRCRAPAAVAAAIVMSLSYGLTTLVSIIIPDAAGWNGPPWSYVLAVPAIGGRLVAVAV